VPLADVMVGAGAETMVTGRDGRFGLVAPTETVRFERVAHLPAEYRWTGEPGFLDVVLSPRPVRALHVTGTLPASDAGYQEMLGIAARTGVNALVLDIKAEAGLVFHRSAVPTVAEVGATYETPWDLEARVAQAHDAGLYVIVRIVSFEDPIAARARPSWAIREADGTLLVHSGQYWLDPTDVDARNYPLDLADEACALGVDEVQFDYVRFPTGDKTEWLFDGPVDAQSRQDAITGFLAEARSRLVPEGCATAADIFGFITHIRHEGNIGQQLESLAAAIDVISPMIYPSHYADGSYGYDDPNAHPAPIVRNASEDALERMTESAAVLRPWLQDFWYSADQVEVQIETMDDLGLGWLLWNVRSQFTVDGIPSEGELFEPTPRRPDLTPLPASGFFDVGDDHRHAAAVAWAGDRGITTGCNPPWADHFCPGAPVTRGQAAAFLARALELTPISNRDTFSDDDGSVFEPEIEAIAAAGITEGCSVGAYCPNVRINRAQLASLLARALDLDPSPDHAFAADDPSVHTEAIAALAAAGITNGCSTDSFCPEEPVIRAHMVTFLHRALTDAAP
jgi:hypothetical protein